MPFDRRLYPSNWDELALSIKSANNWHCQECGKSCRKTGETVAEFIMRVYDLREAEWHEAADKPIRYCLTIAHLNHDPADNRAENLRSLCAPCHLRYDLEHHLRSRAGNKYKKRERAGQLSLEVDNDI